MKFGITEAGDASRDYSWEAQLPDMDGAILITKNVTDEFIRRVMPFKKKVIVHATITGWGSTALEPNVPPYTEALQQVHKLVVKSGFPRNQVVIRIDPIIPTEEGLTRAANVITTAIYLGLRPRCRISLIDMYPHVRKRFQNAGIDDPYRGRFGPHPWQIKKTDEMLYRFRPNCTFESCAESGLREADAVGCVSVQDLALLRLNPDTTELKGQRKGCLCLACKSEMLKGRHPCANDCLYCYWKTAAEGGH